MGSLLAIRLLAPAGRDARSPPARRLSGGVAVLAAAAWSLSGPLRARLVRARRRHHSARCVRPPELAPRARLPAPRPPAVVQVPFTARYAGRLTVEPVNEQGRLTVRIDGALSGATKDHLEILIHGIPLEDGGVAMEQSRVRMGTTTPLYRGEITSLNGTRLVAALRSTHQRLRVALTLRIRRDGSVAGLVRGTAPARSETA